MLNEGSAARCASEHGWWRLIDAPSPPRLYLSRSTLRLVE